MRYKLCLFEKIVSMTSAISLCHVGRFHFLVDIWVFVMPLEDTISKGHTP